MALLYVAGLKTSLALATTPMGSDFEDSNLSPFLVQQCCGNSAVVVDWGDQARGGTKVAKIQWWEANYQDTRSSRGTEVSSETFIEIKKEGWYGFSFWANSTGGNAYNLNTSIGIAQALAHGPDPCPVSWTWILNTTPNGLVLSHRYGMGGWTEAVISPTVPTDRWVDVILHMKYSEPGVSEGLIEVWFDADVKGAKGTPTYARYNIALGLDCWENDSLVTGTKLKFGMYCHTVDEYIPGEKRVIYFDEVAIIDGNPADAWYAVNPESDDSLTPPGPPSGLSAKTRNGHVKLDWLENSESDLTGYHLYRAETAGGPYTRLNEALLPDSRFIDDRINNGSTYYYVVTAVDNGGDESEHGTELAVTHPINLWRNKDIGAVETGGTVDAVDEQIQINASGCGMAGTSDSFHFTYLAASGDCEIIARLANLSDTGDSATAGVMLRDTLARGSRHVLIALSASGKMTFQRRNELATTAISETVIATAAPRWIRLARNGDVLTAYYSDDGLSWTEAGSIARLLGSQTYLGLAVSAGSERHQAQATFDSIAMIGCTDPEEAFYLDADRASGSASVSFDTSSEGGESARFSLAGGWLRFDDVVLQPERSLFRLRASNTGATSKVELRYGRSSGPVLATFTVLPTGTESPWQTFTALAPEFSGTQRLYLVVDEAGVDEVQVNWLEVTTLESSQTTYSPIELWRLEHFASAANLGRAANRYDADLDRRSNLLEYATGTRPLVYDSDSMLDLHTTSTPPHASITFDRIADANLTYTVEVEGNLDTPTWTPIWTSKGAQNLPGPVTVEDEEVIGLDSRRLLRIRITED